MGNHLDKYLKDPAITKLKPQFTKLELYMLAMLFKDLSSRHHGVIDKETFLQFFPLTGLWGERLFSKFDLKHTGHVSFYEFVQGIATCCHSTEDEKIHFLFSLYDIDQDNCIKKKEMITMLYNYPKEHIKFITDEIALDRGEKLGNVTELQRMSLQDLDDGDYDPDTRNQRFGSIHSDHIAGALNDELEVAEEEKLDSCIPREKKIDKTLSQLMQKEDIEKSEVLSPPIDKTATDMINVAPRKKSAQPTGKEAENKEKKPVPNKTTSRNENGVSLVDSALKGVRKDSTSTVITDPSFLIATTVNTRVKEYASFMFKTFESSKKTGKIYYDDFKEWLHMHPMILRVFDETFHQDIWSTQHWDSKDRAKMSVLGYEEADKLVGKEGTLKPSDGKTLIYRERAPEFSGYLYKRGKTWNKRYCELRDHFLICYEKKDAVYPRAILFLDGCFIDDTKDYSTLHKYGFSVSHKSESYEPHKFYCNDKAEYDEWMKHLKLFQSNTIMDMYDFKEKIGTGKFSIVYRAITKDNKHDELAIKVIDKKALKAEEREFLFSELSVIKVLNHPSMIKLIDSIETRTHIYIVTELVKDGDLFDYIVSREYLEEYTASYLMKKLLVGVYYMHNMGVVHRDIKPENIMITLDSDSDGEVKELKIIDFGFAKLMDGDVQLTETCGTPNYVAPEVLRGVGYDKRSDLWSLGVIMYFMLRGYLPFDAHEVNTILKKTLKGYVPFDDAHWDKVSHQGKDLVMRFLNKDPKNRITIEDALKHPWIKDRESLKKYEGVNRKQEESGSDQS